MKDHVLLITVVLLGGLIGAVVAVVAGILQHSASPAAKTIKAGAIGFGSTVGVILLLLAAAGVIAK